MAASALVLVLEGMLPFLDPRRYRAFMARVLDLDDRVLRGMGLASMVFGLLLLFLVRTE